MSVPQLLFLQEDELTPQWKREIVEQLLAERGETGRERVIAQLERISMYHY